MRSKALIAIGAAGVTALIVSGVAVSMAGGQSGGANQGGFEPHRMILYGEFVQSKVPICSSKVHVDSNGLVSPLQCDGGDINLQAYNSLATLAPFIGANEAAQRGGGLTKESSAFDATCIWVRSSANPEGATLQQLKQSWTLASLYFGWVQSFPEHRLIVDQCGDVNMNSEDH